MIKATLINKIFKWGWFQFGYSFRGSVNHHHGRKHDSMQTDMVLKEPRVLYLATKAVRRELFLHEGSQEKVLFHTG